MTPNWQLSASQTSSREPTYEGGQLRGQDTLLRSLPPRLADAARRDPSGPETAPSAARTKVMRGFHTAKTAEELLEAWTVHYNYFRPHVSPRRRTPSQAAGIRTDIRNWEDVPLVAAAYPARPFSPSMANS